jgi:alpha-ketoglutarate-dependent taurine dioxygenase
MAAATKTSPLCAENVKFQPMSGGFGAIASDIDLAEPLSDENRKSIRSAVVKFKVLVFRNQNIDSRQHVDFASSFGKLYLHPTTPRHDKLAEIQLIHPPNRDRLANRLAAAGPGQISAGFHADTSWRLVPVWGGVLRSITLPKTGGDTIWVDAGMAYERLPDSAKRRLEGLYVTHDFRGSLRERGLDYPVVAHLIVQSDPDNNRKVVWVNFAARPKILDIEANDGNCLLESVLDSYEDKENQIRLTWDIGTVVFWNNLSTVHSAVLDYDNFPRLLERVLIEQTSTYGNI